MLNSETRCRTPYIKGDFACGRPHRGRSARTRAQGVLGRILLPGLLAVALAACGQSQAPAGTDTLERGLAADPESLDPHKSRSTESGEVLRDLGEGLMGYASDGELVPRAAERVEISDDGRGYSFHLRPTARWSNGEAVTARDFVYSFRRLLDPATAAFYAQSVLDVGHAAEILAGDRPTADLAVTAIDDHELAIRLAKPTPYFLSLLTHPSTFPVYRAAVERHGGGFARPGRLVTNGAYSLAGWELGSVITLERNPHYWDDASTSIDRVRWHVIPEPSVEVNRYRAGELHVTSSVPPEAIEQMREERPGELRIAQKLGIYYYGFNLKRPPFRDNPKLREALSMAVDREVLARKIVGRGEIPAYSWVPPGVDNYRAPTLPFADMTAGERRAAARRAYEDAGFGEDDPSEVEIRYNSSEAHQRIAVAIQSMWRDTLGVEATLINEEFQVLLSNIQAAKVTEVFRLSWSADYNDAHSFLQVMESDASSNLTGYNDAKFDELMRDAATQTDPETRKLYLEEAEREMLADHPVIPLYFYVSEHLVSPLVSGWEDNVLDYHYSQHLELRSPMN
jgi:oligopeptide transport system substrate-binding protein